MDMEFDSIEQKRRFVETLMNKGLQAANESLLSRQTRLQFYGRVNPGRRLWAKCWL